MGFPLAQWLTCLLQQNGGRTHAHFIRLTSQNTTLIPKSVSLWSLYISSNIVILPKLFSWVSVAAWKSSTACKNGFVWTGTKLRHKSTLLTVGSFERRQTLWTSLRFLRSPGNTGFHAMADLTYIYLKDVRPGMKNLNIVFIVLDIGLLLSFCFTRLNLKGHCHGFFNYFWLTCQNLYIV